MPGEDVCREVSDQAWERALARDPVAALRQGRPVETLPRRGPSELAADVAFAAGLLRKLAGIGSLQAAFVRDHLEQEVREEQRFWYRLPVTPYNLMVLSDYRSEIFATAELETGDDVDRYLKLLDDYGALHPIRRVPTELRTFALNAGDARASPRGRAGPSTQRPSAMSSGSTPTRSTATDGCPRSASTRPAWSSTPA